MLEKIAKAFGKKTFKGKGHRLGSSEADDKAQQLGTGNRKATKTSSDLEPSAQPSSRLGSRGTASVVAFQGRPQKADGVRQQTLQELQEPEDAAQRQAAEASTSSAIADPETVFTSQVASASASPSFLLLDSDQARSVASEDLQSALSQLAAGPENPRSVIKRLFVNILREPQDTKYRRIRLGNPKIQAAIVDADGGLEMLQACGFQVVMEDAGESDQADAYAVLPDDDDLLQMNAALVLLGYRHPKPLDASQLPTTGSPAAPKRPAADSLSTPCARDTQVVLPSGPEGAAQVQEWVFRRTPAELKAAMLEARRKREQSEMLMTRATREKLKAGQKPVYSQSTVRVRLPEGLLLQGCFNANEPVAAIFDWVTDNLADPSTTYELILPDRRPLVTAMGTLKTADLLPNVLLILRCDETSRHQQTLTVKPELLKVT